MDKSKSSWSAVSREFVRTDDRPRVLGIASLGVFVVTGVIWLVAHTQSWPGGYLPWMISLGFFLASCACFLRFREALGQRDAIRRQMDETFDSIRYRVRFGGIESALLVGEVEDGMGDVPFYRFAFGLENASSEVIEFSVIQVPIVLEGGHTYVPMPPGASSGLVLPGGVAGFTCPAIVAPFEPRPLRGSGSYTVEYGHPDSPRKFRVTQSFMITWDELPDRRWKARFSAQGDSPKHELIVN
jgi:hypothetical protein